MYSFCTKQRPHLVCNTSKELLLPTSTKAFFCECTFLLSTEITLTTFLSKCYNILINIIITCTHILTHSHIHTHTHTYSQTHIHTHTHTYALAHTHMHTQTCTHVCVGYSVRVHVCVCVCACVIIVK